MIVLRFTSGLGNQMFQYMFYHYLTEHYKEHEVKADLTWFLWHDEHQGYELERVFGIKMNEASRKEVLHTSGVLPQDFKGAYYVNRVIRLFTEEKKKPFIIDEMTPGYELDREKDWYLRGFYISEKYYEDKTGSLGSYFKFPDESIMGVTETAEKIRNCMSVSLHVRRGDYLSPIYDGKFVNLGDDYYKKATENILSEYPDAHFFVFSDDKDYIEKSFDWLENKTIVTGNDGKDSYKDMYLMSICRHNIIANSTFSTWGALLNENKDAKVIYPRAYLNGTDSEEKNINNWIRI